MPDQNFHIQDKINESGLIICSFTGILSSENVMPLLEEIHLIEKSYPGGFNRFSDLSRIQEIKLSTIEIHEIAERRRSEYNGPQVKSAIYTEDPYSFGMMRIYAAMMEPAPIEVEIFYSQKEANQWLQVQI